MSEERELICTSFEETIPKLDETKKALLLAYGEGMDAGMNIGLNLAREAMKAEGKAEGKAEVVKDEACSHT